MPYTDTTRRLSLMQNDVLLEGNFVVAGVTEDVITGVNGETGVLPFGRAVIYDTTATGGFERNVVIRPTTAGQVIRGITLATKSIDRIVGQTLDTNGQVGYPANPQGSAIDLTVLPGIAVKGVIAVRTSEAVVKGDVVTAVITAGATRGTFGKTANAAQIACPSTWEWWASAASGAIGYIWMK